MCGTVLSGDEVDIASEVNRELAMTHEVLHKHLENLPGLEAAVVQRGGGEVVVGVVVGCVWLVLLLVLVVTVLVDQTSLLRTSASTAFLYERVGEREHGVGVQRGEGNGTCVVAQPARQPNLNLLVRTYGGERGYKILARRILNSLLVGRCRMAL